MDKDAPKKKGVFLFAEILSRKFFNLIKANLLLALTSIPFFAITLFLTARYVTLAIIPNITMGNMESAIFNIFIAGFVFNLLGSGPASAAYAYVTRSFTRSEPVWVASDGFDAFKENFKYSILLVVVDIVVTYLAMNAVVVYGSMEGEFSVFLKIFVLSLYLVYAVSHAFAYQIMVTYECKFIDIIKYSIVMTFAKLPMCIILLAVTCAVYMAIWFFNPVVATILYLVIGLTFTRYPLEFYAARVIEKNIEKTQPKTTEDDGEEEEE